MSSLMAVFFTNSWIKERLVQYSCLRSPWMTEIRRQRSFCAQFHFVTLTIKSLLGLNIRLRNQKTKKHLIRLWTTGILKNKTKNCDFFKKNVTFLGLNTISTFFQKNHIELLSSPFYGVFLLQIRDYDWDKKVSKTFLPFIDNSNWAAPRRWRPWRDPSRWWSRRCRGSEVMERRLFLFVALFPPPPQHSRRGQFVLWLQALNWIRFCETATK